jgi:thermitase
VAPDKAAGDPLRAKQWALTKVNIEGAWRVTRGSPKIKIASVDSGADLGHPDLRGQIADSWRASGLMGRMGLAGAGDDCGHGTHCAGIAGAAAGNNEGIAGAAPGCKLLIVKALDKAGAGPTSDIVRGIRWAMSHGAHVISLSVGGEEDSRALRDACQDALQAGIVVVAAMGNDGKTVKNWPACIPGVIAVGATNKTDGVAGFSTRGGWISVAAPGANILSTAPTYAVTMNRGKDAELGRGYGTLSGTSMATPLVAGIVALMLSANPNLKPAQVKAALEKSAVGAGGMNIGTGHGRVDAALALAAVARK